MNLSKALSSLTINNTVHKITSTIKHLLIWNSANSFPTSNLCGMLSFQYLFSALSKDILCNLKLNTIAHRQFDSSDAGSNVCSSRAFMENTSDWMCVYGAKGKVKEKWRGECKDIYLCSIKFSWDWHLLSGISCGNTTLDNKHFVDLHDL